MLQIERQTLHKKRGKAMYTAKNEYFLNFVIVVVIIVGLMVGYSLGELFMAPDALDVENALKYPSLYGDKILEKEWNGTCTAVTASVWVITLVTATKLYFKRLELRYMTEVYCHNQEMMKKGIKIAAPSENEE